MFPEPPFLCPLVFLKSSDGLVKTSLSSPHFHVQNSCRVSIQFTVSVTTYSRFRFVCAPHGLEETGSKIRPGGGCYLITQVDTVLLCMRITYLQSVSLRIRFLFRLWGPGLGGSLSLRRVVFSPGTTPPYACASFSPALVAAADPAAAAAAAVGTAVGIGECPDFAAEPPSSGCDPSPPAEALLQPAQRETNIATMR